MTAQLIDGRAHAQILRQVIQEKAQNFIKNYQRPINLTVILVGEHPASLIYVNNKIKASKEVGIHSHIIQLPESISQEYLLEVIDKLNQDDEVDGILLQLPIPDHLNTYQTLSLIDPQKDVDGLTPHNQGLLMQARPYLVPCTPQGCAQLIYHCIPQVAGKNAVVVGRSILVGRPMAALLTNLHATVTLAHSQTKVLSEVCRQADILVVAIGQPQYVDESFIKPGAVVIDVGMNRLPGGKIVGDVDFKSVSRIAGYITPVPGGVGPMTIANLLWNTVKAAEERKRYGSDGTTDKVHGPYS
jgi:methylenetetrahydrofolate dehydrogenase (NADP+) / methenyltetrahydrofolate cyclohydrolase